MIHFYKCFICYSQDFANLKKIAKQIISSLDVKKNNNGTQILDVTGLTKPTNRSGEIKLLSKSRFILNMIKSKTF